MEIVRAGLAGLLTATFAQVEVSGAANWDAMDRVAQGPWDLIIIEPMTAGCEGAAWIRKIRAANPRTPILALSVGSEQSLGLVAIHAGANGFLSKAASCEEIVEAIARVTQGSAHMSAALEERVTASRSPFARREGYAALSEKERTVLHALASGQTAKEIAVRLGIAASSVGTYRGRLLRKLRLRTTAELIRYVAEHRLDASGTAILAKSRSRELLDRSSRCAGGPLLGRVFKPLNEANRE